MGWVDDSIKARNLDIDWLSINEENILIMAGSGHSCPRMKMFWYDHEDFFDSRFFILKHADHSSYVDRMSGSKNCEVFHLLYDLYNMPDSLSRCEGYIHKFEGRWNKGKFEEVNNIINSILNKEAGIIK